MAVPELIIASKITFCFPAGSKRSPLLFNSVHLFALLSVQNGISTERRAFYGAFGLCVDHADSAE